MKQAKHIDPEELRPYIGKWVSLDQSGDQERIVASGENAKECADAADRAGHRYATLMFVPGGNTVPG